VPIGIFLTFLFSGAKAGKFKLDNSAG